MPEKQLFTPEGRQEVIRQYLPSYTAGEEGFLNTQTGYPVADLEVLEILRNTNKPALEESLKLNDSSEGLLYKVVGCHLQGKSDVQYRIPLGNLWERLKLAREKVGRELAKA